jgi:hypothetical protein
MFGLKLLRVIEDIDGIFGEGANPSLTDTGSLAYYDEDESRVFFDTVDITDKIKHKLSRDEATSNYDLISDFTWLANSSGYIAYKSDKIFYIRVDVKTHVEENELKVSIKAREPMQLGIHLNAYELSITNVYRGPNPFKITICWSTDQGENIFLLWDWEKNREIQNYSNSGNSVFVTGRDSDSGYILNGNKYINMDQILDNYFFDVEFGNYYKENLLLNGYKMSKNEDVLLCFGMILLKVSYIDAKTVDYLMGTEKLTEENIHIEKIKFQIQGNTIIHLFALNYDSLLMTLNYIAEFDQRYLTMILIKNNNKKSPLDLTIEHDSPKTTELLLRHLSLLNTGSYSNLIYHNFERLLSMNLRSFYEYLDSWFFQTIEMQNTKYIPLDEGTEFPWVGAHKSCLLDEIFREKYTVDGKERKKKRHKDINFRKAKERSYYNKEKKKNKQMAKFNINDEVKSKKIMRSLIDQK